MSKALLHLLNPFKILIAALLTFSLSLLICLIYPFLKQQNPVFTRIQKTWGRLLLALLQIRISHSGLERVDTDTPRIFLANHSSYLDIFLLTARLPGKVIFLGKKELNRIPVFGWSWVIAGNVPIDRHSPRAFMQSLEMAGRRVRDGYSLVVFPEGTRSPDGIIRPFKRGFTRIARKAGARIYPVTINGAYQLFSKNDRLVRPGKVQLIIHEPLDPDYHGKERDTEHQILRYTREKILEFYHPPAPTVPEAETG